MDDLECPHVPSDLCKRRPITRRFRQVLSHLERTVAGWNAHGVGFGLQMGDLIDGANRPDKRNTVDEALRTALAPFTRFNGAVHHVLGNNEVRTMTPAQMASIGQVENPEAGGARCSQFVPCAGWRVFVLDSFCFSAMHQPGDSSRLAATHEWLKAHGSPRLDTWPPQRAVTDIGSRWSDGGGAFGEAQLGWLEQQLHRCREAGEKVVLVGHEPVHPHVVNNFDGLAWDYDEMMGLIRRYSDVVWVYLAGHDHQGGYSEDETGVFHLTVPAPLEAEPESSVWVVMDLHEDRIVLGGCGRARVDPGLNLRESVWREQAEEDGEQWVEFEKTVLLCKSPPASL
eukprot:TRINITY_DN12804_c0_g1_i1.p1 TRINITY_DN12804_c0_g1~~TRINITY_DN12804_c0_g1_i1.p1  ORF type:complete len:341 (-),score=79.74 TRINITY_DN12804_c0_g1_i1:475-1497(-)